MCGAEGDVQCVRGDGLAPAPEGAERRMECVRGREGVSPQ